MKGLLSKFFVGFLITLFVAFPSVIAASDDSGLTLQVKTHQNVMPGEEIFLQIKFSDQEAVELSGLDKAEIVLQYDEKVFSTEGRLMVDEAGREVWRDDMHTYRSVHEGIDAFGLGRPYPQDVDPSDGMQEIVLTLNGDEVIWAPEWERENILTIGLFVRKDAPAGTSVISLRNTILTDRHGNVLKYQVSQPNVTVQTPVALDVVKGTLQPSPDPFILTVGHGTEMNSSAYFLTGPKSYITNMLEWESSDPTIFEVTHKGSVRGVKPGTATLIVRYGEIKAHHPVIVISSSENHPQTERHYNNRDYIQVRVDDSLSAMGRLVDGHTYIQLRALGESLGFNIGYDQQGKHPIINGTPVKAFKNLDGKTYIKARDIQPLLGTDFHWDNNNKILSISKK
ncbi:hypothetical protein [Paenibacillus sp. 1P07SE]|uniref:hypothetical protein n=1 Tax=Paenibacillus sp. 1P07SE TaxID=3132209 RepID=UPI0039A613DA